MPEDDGALLDRLRRCLPPQFEWIMLDSGIPADIISPNTVPLATRATEFIGWARQSPENRRALLAALDRVSRGSSQIRLSAEWKPPLSFALLIGRQDQEDLVEERLADAATSGTHAVTFLLPGCSDESPQDFVERCALFTQRRVMRDAAAPRIVQFHDRPLAWPPARLSRERRIARLREELGDLIGISATGLDDEILAAAVADWVARDRAHKVLHYPIFVTQVSRRDKSLIAYLADFWRSVKLPRPDLGVTVFICIHCRSSWLQRYWGPAASCVRHVRSRFKDVCILDHLEPPRQDEVDHWVDVKCREAWELTDPRRAGGLERPKMPLHGDELKLAAKTAFGGRARLPFFPLKPALERSIERAHEKFLGRGGTR